MTYVYYKAKVPFLILYNFKKNFIKYDTVFKNDLFKKV